MGSMTNVDRTLWTGYVSPHPSPLPEGDWILNHPIGEGDLVSDRADWLP